MCFQLLPAELLVLLVVPIVIAKEVSYHSKYDAIKLREC